MKYLLLLSLVCTNFVIGQKYDKNFTAQHIDYFDDLNQNKFTANKRHPKLLYKTLRNAIKPNVFDKEIAKQFYEHIEQCDPFVRYPSDNRQTPLSKGNKELLKICFKKLRRNDIVVIDYEIAPESPLYEIINNKYNETVTEIYDDEYRVKNDKTSDNLGWITYNTHCYLESNNNFSCSSTFFAKDYLKMIEEFEKEPLH